MPIAINKTTYVEKKTNKITYGKDELKGLLITELEKEFEDEKINELNVINKIVNFYEKDNTIELEMTYEVKCNIGVEEKFEK